MTSSSLDSPLRVDYNFALIQKNGAAMVHAGNVFHEIEYHENLNVYFLSSYNTDCIINLRALVS